MWIRFVLGVACLLGASGVGLGAYQAHGLERTLEKLGVSPADAEKRIDNCGTAVRYQMTHALALLAIGALSVATRRPIIGAPVLMMLGVLAFSGGLYLIVFTGESYHWAIVPSGGAQLIVGWLLLLVAALRVPLESASR